MLLVATPKKEDSRSRERKSKWLEQQRIEREKNEVRKKLSQAKKTGVLPKKTKKKIPEPSVVRTRAAATPKPPPEKEASQLPKVQARTTTNGSKNDNPFFAKMELTALIILKQTLQLADDHPEQVQLTDYLGAQLLFQFLYGITPDTHWEWHFLISDLSLLDEIIDLSRIVQPPLTMEQHDHHYYSKQITISKQTDENKTLPILNLFFKEVTEIENTISVSLPPYHNISTVSPEGLLDHFLLAIQGKIIFSKEIYGSIKQWRKLDQSLAKLEPSTRNRLFNIAPQFEPLLDPLIDIHIRYRLPEKASQHDRKLKEPETLPDSLKCSTCQKPAFNALVAPCGRTCCRECVETLPRDITPATLLPVPAAPRCPGIQTGPGNTASHGNTL